MRKLARIAQITDIKPIEGADRIECATVDNGWEVVAKKGEYAPGDVAIYCEIDSWVPHSLAPFLTPKDREPKEYNGVKGERLRTVKLRGQISQGLLLPVTAQFIVSKLGAGPGAKFTDYIGREVTEVLGIQKWEAPIPACLSGEVEGPFPSFIPKTDQERCQNLYTEIFTDHYAEEYEVTTKLDGTSCTIYLRGGEVGVCGRNWELKETAGNTLWRCAHAQGIITALLALYEETGDELAIQGEVIGEGIQGNPEKLKGQKFFVYDIYDIKKRRYMNAYVRAAYLLKMSRLCQSSGVESEISMVPLVEVGRVLRDRGFSSIEDLVKYADGPSLNEKVKREGVVFKSTESGFHFKSISPHYLIAHPAS